MVDRIKDRKHKLRRLKSRIEQHEEALIQALKLDLNRCDYESLMAEVYPCYKEINYYMRKLPRLCKVSRTGNQIATLQAKNYIESLPYGTVAIISPWNYPVQLGLIPLIGAIAAGNKVILKPSELSPNTSSVLAAMLEPLNDFIQVVEGGVAETNEVLDRDIQYVFFTGSTKVGRVVADRIAKRLIPFTLELGGKSPCIVTSTCNITVAAKRILFAKILNAGQTCISPDYVLVEDSIKEAFTKELVKQARIMNNKRTTYAKIISEQHFRRLEQLIGVNDIICYQQEVLGDNIFGLTILACTKESPSMKEEIFGPILPILEYSTNQEAVEIVHSVCKNPLALYLFTSNKKTANDFSRSILSGGMCVNDCLMHINNNELPFGGVGESGIGKYHGRHSFETFSHQRGVLYNKNSLLFDIRYGITDKKISYLKKILS